MIAVLAVIGAVAAVAAIAYAVYRYFTPDYLEDFDDDDFEDDDFEKMTSRMKTNPIVSEKVYKDATGWSTVSVFFKKIYELWQNRKIKRKQRARYS